jgi:signal transduction histidine kinase
MWPVKVRWLAILFGTLKSCLRTHRELALGAAVSGPALTLTVTDTGSGIPPELLPRVFEPYVTTKTKGLGLGLAIARRIVEAHGGRIEAESGAGQGTCFRVTLPRDGSAGG